MAGSLNNLANSLRDVGKSEEAHDFARESVRLWRALSAANPDSYTHHLAESLNSLAGGLSDLGNHDEALNIVREAVDIWRDLAEANPDAFNPQLALTLGNLASGLHGVGKHDEALAPLVEAIQKLTPHYLALPVAHERSMSRIVRNYLKLAETLGREPDAKLLGPVAEIFASLESQDDDDDNGK